MSLTPEDLAAIEAIVRVAVAPLAPPPAAPIGAAVQQWLPRRLRLAEFAACIEVSDEVARRYLRANKHGIKSQKIAINDGTWKIDIRALPLFGVTPALAVERLAQLRAAPARAATPAQSPQLAPA